MPFRPTPENLIAIFFLWTEGVPHLDISLRMGYSLVTLERWIRRFEQEAEGGNPARDGRYMAGRPLKVTDNEMDQVVEVIQNDPFQPVNRLPALLGIQVH